MVVGNSSLTFAVKCVILFAIPFLSFCGNRKTPDCKFLLGQWKSETIVEDPKNQAPVLKELDPEFIESTKTSQITYVFGNNGALLNGNNDTIGTFRLSNCDTIFISRFH